MAVQIYMCFLLVALSFSGVITPTSSQHSPWIPWQASWIPWELPKRILGEFPNEASTKLDPSRFEFQIKLLSYTRVGPTLRFLRSIERADYFGDRVNLEIFVDHPYNRELGWKSMPEWKRKPVLEETEALIRALDNFTWSHGTKSIHARAVNGGMQPQWVEAWWPEHVNQFTFIAESDLEVSPHFYSYVKRMIMFYYYNQSNFNPSFFGVALQNFQSRMARDTFALRLPGEAFLHPHIGTWGQILFPIPWKNFRLWYSRNRYFGREPVVENLESEKWYKREGNRIWSQWFVLWSYTFPVLNIYSSFPDKLALSVSHRESGVDYNHTLGPEATLVSTKDLTLGEEGSGTTPEWWMRMPPPPNMSRYDFCFRKVPSLHPVVRSVAQLKAVMHDFHADWFLLVLPVQATNVSYPLIRNWICSWDGVNTYNFLILYTLIPEPPSHLRSSALGSLAQCLDSIAQQNQEAERQAEDLAARGYLVYVAPARSEFRTEEHCSSEAVKVRTESMLSLEHVRVIQDFMAFDVGILVTSLRTRWLADPFHCMNLGEVMENVALWTRPLLSGQGLSSYVLWLRKSATVLKEVIKQWEAQGVLDLAAMSDTQLATFKRLCHQRDATNLSTRMGRCVTSSSRDIVKDGSPALVLESEKGEEELRRKGHWFIDDYDNACKIVTCKKKYDE